MTTAKGRIAWAIAAVLIALGIVGIVVDRREGGWDGAVYEARLFYLTCRL